MILCITPNPAIDRTIVLPSLRLGEVHRAEWVIVAAGGKGLNVARTIRIFGWEPLCMGFAGGHAGHLLADLAQDEGLDSFWTWTKTETRTCTILVSQNNDATEVDEPGFPVSKSDWKRLQRDVRKFASSTSLACVSGSFPPNSSEDNLAGLLKPLVDMCKQVWVDTSGAALNKVLNYRDICVKVNGTEISKSLGFEVQDVASAQRALMTLGERGIRTSVITLGVDGALLSTAEGRWYARSPRVRVISTVGSGDSFLGGLVSAVEAGKDWREALRDAVAAGTANVLSPGGGQFSLQEFMDIQQKVQVETW